MAGIAPALAKAHGEIIAGMQGDVEKNLSLLGRIDSVWQPSDFLPDLTREDWGDQLLAFREQAQGITNKLLVVLVGDMVTE